MDKVIIELNSAGIQELLKSKEIEAFCEKKAEKMTREAGVPYVSDVHIGRTRVVVGGYKKKENNEDGDICPKCGYAHPNCNCKKK